MKLNAFIKFTAPLLFVALFPFGNLNAQRSITVENVQEKLSGMDLKMGLNIVDGLPDGYNIGLVRKSGSPDQWVTVAPDGKTTQPVTKAVGKGGNTSDIMTWECVYRPKKGWICNCIGNCDF